MTRGKYSAALRAASPDNPRAVSAWLLLAVMKPALLQAAGASTITIARRDTQSASAPCHTVIGVSPLRVSGGMQSRLNKSVFCNAFMPVFAAASPRYAVASSWALSTARSAAATLDDAASSSKMLLPAAGAGCATGTAVPGKAAGLETLTKSDSVARTRSARRALSFTVRLTMRSVAPVAISRTVKLKRSAAVKPNRAATSADTAASMRALKLLPHAPWEAASRSRDAILMIAFAGFVSVGLYSRTITACAPPFW